MTGLVKITSVKISRVKIKPRITKAKTKDKNEITIWVIFLPELRNNSS